MCVCVSLCVASCMWRIESFEVKVCCTNTHTHSVHNTLNMYIVYNSVSGFCAPCARCSLQPIYFYFQCTIETMRGLCFTIKITIARFLTKALFYPLILIRFVLCVCVFITFSVQIQDVKRANECSLLWFQCIRKQKKNRKHKLC